MPFARPTLSEIVTRIESDYKSRIDNAQSLLRRSVLKILARVYGAAVHLLYGYLSYMKDQPFATTADAEYLERIGNEFGIARKAATNATGSGSGTGTTGVSIPAGTQLVSNAGQVYTVDSAVTVAAGVYSLDFTALLAGSDGNDSPSISLIYVTPIAGVSTTLTVDGDGIDGGVDEESDDGLRERILTRKRQPPHGGAEFDYVNWALEVSGVTRAWSFPQYMGHGTIGLAFVRDNDTDSIIPDATEREDVRDYILEHTDPLTGLDVGIPVTAEPGFFVIDISLESVDFSISITPNNSATQADIESKIEDLIIEKGGPGQTIYLSDISAAISSSALEVAHRVNSPATDIATATNKVPVLGIITWSTY